MSEAPSRSTAFLSGGGKAADMIRGRDWSSHPLGPPERWPDALRVALSLVLNSPESMILCWGPELHFFFNDTYFPMLGPRLSWAMGARFDEVWADGLEQAMPIIEDAMAGRSTRFVDLPWKLGTDRGAANTWWTFSYSRVLDADGAVAGLFILTNETTEHVRSAAALRASEARNRQILDSAIDYAIVATDLDGRVTRWNEGAHRVLGWSEAEMLGERVECFFTPEDVAAGRVATEMRNALETGHGNDERWHQRKGGERFWAVGEMTVLRDEQGAAVGFVKVLRDRTEHRRAEQQLRDLNDTLEQRVQERTRERDRVWRNAQDMIVIIDATGAFIDVNPAVARVLGWTADEMIGRTVFDFILEEDIPSTRGALDHAIHEDLPIYVNRYRHKDGSFRWISWVAAPENDLIYAYGRNVTVEREQAKALRLHDNIVQSDQSPICAFDADYKLIAFNKAHNDEFHRVNGFYTKVGDVLPDLFVPEQRETMRALMRRALTGEAFSVVEEFGKPELGKPFWEISYTPLRDEAGTIIGAFHHAKDISARLRTEVELRDAQEALRQSQKMEAVGQLTGGLAHDFNNLLTGITGSLDMIGRRVAQGRTGELDHYVQAAQGASRRAAALTHRLLAFSRRQTLDPKPTDVSRLIAGMADLIRRTVGPAVTVETVDAVGLWTALVDPSQLENALLNLTINARDAMPGGGRITIETANRWMDERAARERDVPPGQYLSLCVSDTGTGMPPEVIARAFDPFFTTKPIGMGTGLGLSMIYGFARQSGGQVRIYSEVGQGSMVCIYLPRHYGAEVVTEGIAERAETPRAEVGETVLVVDDEPTIRMLVCDVLGDLGYAAVEAEDGPSGLKVLRSDARIDLLVTDVGLPGGMNGRQVADAARALRPGLKVLFITGYAENAAVGNGHLEPGMAVMTKPFAMDDLAGRIRGLIEA